MAPFRDRSSDIWWAAVSGVPLLCNIQRQIFTCLEMCEQTILLNNNCIYVERELHISASKKKENFKIKISVRHYNETVSHNYDKNII